MHKMFWIWWDERGEADKMTYIELWKNRGEHQISLGRDWGCEKQACNLLPLLRAKFGPCIHILCN